MDIFTCIKLILYHGAVDTSFWIVYNKISRTCKDMKKLCDEMEGYLHSLAILKRYNSTGRPLKGLSEILHGKCEIFNKEGALLTRCQYVNGKIIGRSIQFYTNGSLYIDCFFNADGKLDGDYIHGSKNGNKAIVCRYKSGVKIGKSENYHSDGTKCHEFEYVYDSVEGVFKKWLKERCDKGTSQCMCLLK